MGRNRRTDRELKSTLDVVKENSNTIAENSQIIVENSQTMVENTGRTNEKLDDMKNDVAEIRKNTASKLPIIIAIIGVIVAIIGVIASISGISFVDIISNKKTVDAVSEQESEYKIYLYPEYSKFSIYAEVDMTASLNFDTDAVNITAHLASGKEESVSLEQKNSEEWQKKVIFDEVGVHEVVVAATAPNGEVIENSIEVEVTPVSIGMDMNIDMDVINQLLGQ